MNNLLDRIVASTRRAVEEAKRGVPIEALLDRAARLPPRDGPYFRRALEAPGMNIVAEAKRRSPVKGLLVRDYDAAELARAYERGGAAAVSVLTEREHFGGSLADLAAVREKVRLPILCKDFVVDSYQIVEAACAGADAVLLIMAILDDATAHGLLEACGRHGIDALIEVHDRGELGRALDVGANLIGVNNRDLTTFAVEAGTSLALIEEIPDWVVAVSESGLTDAVQLARLRFAGFDAFLIGESLVTQSDPATALRELRTKAAAEEIRA